MAETGIADPRGLGGAGGQVGDRDADNAVDGVDVVGGASTTGGSRRSAMREMPIDVVMVFALLSEPARVQDRSLSAFARSINR